MTTSVTRGSALRALLTSEAIGGVLLMVAATAAMVAANSPWTDTYFHMLHYVTGPQLAPELGPMTVHLWINDGLMAVFFLFVGLEIKREVMDGRLASAAQRRLPVVAAIAGMALPALLYLVVLRDHPDLAKGWAIPAATDIAFAMGVLALLGKRAPTALKLLLVTIAIVDDMGAVAIIAFAYTAGLNAMALGGAALVLAGMFALNRLGVRAVAPYILGFALLWYAVLLSGIHATIAGVLAACAVPVVATPGAADSPASTLHRMIHVLDMPVALLVVPLFGFANAGMRFDTLSGNALLAPLPIAIAVALFLGKQLGVFGAIWLAAKTGFAARPRGATWAQVYGMALLCGIGFTMSLFIGALAFDNPALVEEAKIGTLIGSLVSAVAGFAVLRFARLHPLHESEERRQNEEIEIDGDTR